jgi:hypothetical protein
MKIHRTTLVLLLVCGCLGAYAQPQVEITIQASTPSDTTVDFGVTFVGNHTRRSLSIRNVGSDTAVLKTGSTPFIEIANVPWVPSGDTRYQNFVVDSPFPVVVPPGQVALVELRYLALEESAISRDSAIEAYVRLRVARSAEPDGPFAERLFLMRGRRTLQVLVTSNPVIRFDSVYVNLNRRLQETFRVRNLTDKSVDIERQTLEIKTTVVGEPEISADIKPSVIIGARDSAFWDIYYQPRNLGYDSAVFTIQYRLDTTSGPVTLDTKISGVGVEQRLRIIDVMSDQVGTGLRWYGDTVDFGTVASAQDTVRATIIVENVGNLDPRILSEQKRLLTGGTAADTASFRIVQRMDNGFPIILRGARDTIVVTYAPATAGESLMRYAIATDILSRQSIRAVPVGAEVMSFVMIGRQRRARISVDPALVVFDTVAYSSSCVSVVRDSLRITNTGDRVLDVSAIRSRAGSLALQATPQTLAIEPLQSAIVQLVFRPDAEGTIVDTIDIVSNAHQQTVVGVPYRVVAQRLRDTVVMRMPDTVSARPGYENVIVDVSITSTALQSLSRCTLAINVDTTVLHFERALSYGTATELAGSPERLPNDGYSMRLGWTAPSTFADRPVFTRLVFSARLGDRLDSPLGIISSASTFGTAGCPDLVPVASVSGVFRIDSLCGLSYKTAMLRNQSLAAVFPNPVVDNGRLTLVMPRRERLRAVCIDAFGRERMVVADGEHEAGTHAVEFDAHDLPPATYTIIVWVGSRYLAVPFVVGR